VRRFAGQSPEAKLLRLDSREQEVEDSVRHIPG
jgi:hypothetical protein